MNQNDSKYSYKDNLKSVFDTIAKIPKSISSVFDSEAENLKNAHPFPLQLKAGDPAPLFNLPDANGDTVSLEELLQAGSVIIVFYRGQWCPFCNLHLTKYEAILPFIREKGAELVAISPQNPDATLSTKEKNKLSFSVLSDTQNKVARLYTTIHKPSTKYIAALKEFDVEFEKYYDYKTGYIPIPAVFAIDQKGTIKFAASEGGDYTKRTEPLDVVSAL